MWIELRLLLHSPLLRVTRSLRSTSKTVFDFCLADSIVHITG